jgi:hypothetical protein
MGDTRELDKEGKVVVRDGSGKVLARLNKVLSGE